MSELHVVIVPCLTPRFRKKRRRSLAGYSSILLAAGLCSTALFAKETIPLPNAPGALPVGVSMAGKPQPRFGPPPRLTVLNRSPEQETKALKEAEPYLSDPVELPEGHAGWSFAYANPRTGTPLKPLSATEHQDPKTGEIFTDEPTLAAYRTRLHYRAEKAALALATAWAVSGDEKYGQEVRRILLKLATDYPGYPARLDRWGRRGFFARWGGRRYVQSLDEATGVIPLAKAYDLTRSSPLYTDAERKQIERDFFRATANSLLRFNQDISNHQTWYNAGLMAIAGVLGDEALAKRVVTMKGGYLNQLQRSVGNDGLWWEGALAYHLYALRAMMALVDLGESCGLPLSQEPKFRQMFTAPITMAFPDGKLPAINDSDPMGLNSFRTCWEWATIRWQDPLLERLLSDPIEQIASRLPSAVLPDAGLVILRRGSGDKATAAYIDFGPHGGAHGHYDKLNLILYTHGREWLPDPGRLTYSHPEYKTWVKTTAAHNTVAIDERNQYPVEGALLYFQEGDGYAAAGAECRGAYEGTLMRRHLVLTDRFLVDTFEVIAPRRLTLDLLTHARAKELRPVGDAGTPKPISLTPRDGFQHLSPAIELPAGANRWRFIAEDGKQLGLYLSGAEDERLITTTGIGYQREEKTPTLIRRAHSRVHTFTTVYDLAGDAIEAVTFPAERMTEITAEGKVWQITVDRQGAKIEKR